MFVPGSAQRTVLATLRPVDFRRGHDAPPAAAAPELGVDIPSGVIVVFRPKRGERQRTHRMQRFP